MRIGMISTEIDEGGAARAMQRTIVSLKDAGHDVVLITLRPGPGGHAQIVQISEHTARWPARVAGVAHYFYNGRYVDKNRSDLSNTLFWIPAVGVELASVVGTLGLDVINVHWTAYFLSLRALDELLALPIPTVFTLHDMANLTGGCHYSAGCTRFTEDCHPCPQIKRDPLKVPRHVRRRRGEVYAFGRPLAIAPSHWMAEQARLSGLFAQEHVAHVPNSLDLEVFSPKPRRAARAEIEAGPNTKAILFGAFDNREQRKGFDLLLEAMRQLLERYSLRDDTDWLAVGIGSNLPKLDLPGLRVFETGFINDDQRLAQIYSACDVTVVPSREDNLPNVMVEALACGCPVAGFAIGGLPDMIDDDVTGALAKSFEPPALADAMARVLQAGQPMRKAARQNALHAFNPGNHARAYIDIFAKARQARGFAIAECRSTRSLGWNVRGSHPRPTRAAFFGGLPARALITARAMLR